ncbi:DEAD/DEAH box helicase [Sphingobacterium sp. SYP-B4668]|uniref:DEAD/DEAH box helicase n=1 Tax=Sphingobacterium sp. SYP-B4668 TaxID=2996035 RepID=UPI0022DDB4F9|nr:DEAD/DEAH box helicase [Sphingobacterium sp. SYP-B4668]
MKFTEFGFAPLLEEGLDSMGYLEATPIQQQAIPVILQQKDLIACAQTGTGKTASYLLPILHKIAVEPSDHINTIILSPTRELALQIDQQIMGLAYFTGATSIAVYGGGDGMDYEQQKRSIREGVNIIVATPGRLIAHLSSGKANFSKLQHLILDEADRMLDMGFYEDIIRIISYLPEKRQNLLFSATMPFKIRALAKKILHDPTEINIALSKPSDGIKQQAYLVYDEQKGELIKNILSDEAYSSVIIFASKKEIVKRLAIELSKKGIAIEAFHSDLEQAQREDIMNRFKAKRINVLVGTDVISRGIDVVGISLVINYDVPPDPEDYIHRVGRTARAATTGTAITFINTKDQFRFGNIEDLIGSEIEKVPLPAGFSEGPIYDPKRKPQKKKINRKKKNFRKPAGAGAPKVEK